MSQKPPRKPIPKREIFLRIWVYGAALTVSLLGFGHGWFEKIATWGT